MGVSTPSVSTTPPASFAPYGVTDLNRQTLWSILSAGDQAKYTSSSSAAASSSVQTTGTYGSSSATSSSGSGSGSTGSFISLAKPSALNPASFVGLINAAQSATPTNDTLLKYTNLWADTASLQTQLTGAQGGALFATVQDGGSINYRPYNGDLASYGQFYTHGRNPFGYTDGSGNFVQMQATQTGVRSGSFSTLTEPTAYNLSMFNTTTNTIDTATASWNSSTVGWDITPFSTGSAASVSHDSWVATARYKYDQYETLVSGTQAAIDSQYGTTQGLVGIDLNNNGKIDNESELFGFDKGVSLTGAGGTNDSVMMSVKNSVSGATDQVSLASLGLTNFLETGQFLSAGSQNLVGDPRLSDTASLSFTSGNDTISAADLYRRYMVLKPDGNSIPLMNSQLGYNSAINSYVRAQSLLDLPTSGGAVLSSTALDGISAVV